MEPKHQNYTFIDKKQCSLPSSRGKTSLEKSSITIIFQEKILIPSTLIYIKSIYPKKQSRGRSFYKKKLLLDLLTIDFFLLIDRPY
jgi:hypothetical protein